MDLCTAVVGTVHRSGRARDAARSSPPRQPFPRRTQPPKRPGTTDCTGEGVVLGAEGHGARDMGRGQINGSRVTRG